MPFPVAGGNIAKLAYDSADEAKQNANSVRDEFDRVVAEAGSNNPEVVQARGSEVNLNSRLNKFDTQISDLSVNVKSKQFGAKGDGVTNDSAAFQAANDYLKSKGGGKLLVPSGTFIANFIVDSNITIEGVGVKPSVIKAVSGANKDVIQGRDFLTLTGTAKQTPERRGVRYVQIKNILIDGNKTNNPSGGYGIRLWGCAFYFDNLVVQNCLSGGIYTEFTTHESPVGVSDPSFEALESFFNNIKTINNDGDGWTYKGPHDGSITNLITFGNKGWGLNQVSGSLTGFLWNSWLNDLGSFYIGTSLHCYKMQATSGYTSTGIEINANAGNVMLADVYMNGNTTGLILRGTNIRVSGTLLNSRNLDNTAGTGVRIDGANNFAIDLTGSGNHNVFEMITLSGNNKIEGNFVIGTGKTLSTGNLTSGASFVNVVARGAVDEHVYKLPTRTIEAGGWKPILPQSNGTIIADNTVPTSTKRGGVLQQTSPANLTAAPTMADFNNLLTLLKSSGVLG